MIPKANAQRVSLIIALRHSSNLLLPNFATVIANNEQAIKHS
jgi:hypothetical protein